MNSARRFLHATARRLLPVLLLSPAVSRATNYTVTSFADSGAGSLRNAIAAANANPGEDIISLTGLAGTITLTAASGPLTITDTVTITGSGARLLAVTGNQVVSVLHLTGQLFAPVRARISGLTLRDGRAPVSGSLTASGGGIVVNEYGVLEMYDCTLSGHRAQAPAASGAGAIGLTARGGAAFIAGGAIFYRCTFSGNIATGSAGITNAGTFARGGAGGAAQGGAIFVEAAGALTADTCTFYGNTATGGAGANAHFGGNGGAATGAAIFARENTTVTACTISGNSGQGGPGGDGNGNINDGAAGAGTGGLFQTAGGTHTVRSSICAGNTGNGGSPGDVSGTFTSGGYNLIGASVASHGFITATDQTGTPAAPLAAGLAAPQNNGGPTNTMLPLAGSPALDRGKSFAVPIQDCSLLFGCFGVVPLADQRGLSRPRDVLAFPNAPGGDGSDTGAVEMRPPGTSTPVLHFIAGSPGRNLLLTALPSTRYQLQMNSDLGSVWTNLGTAVTADDVGEAVLTDETAPTIRRFYRAVAAP